MKRVKGLLQVSLFILSVVWGLGQPNTAKGEGDAKAEAVLREVFQVYKKRKEDWNPLWIRYRFMNFESAAFRRASQRNPPVEPGEASWSDEGEFARKGEKTLSWARTDNPAFPAWGRERKAIFNGEISCTPGGEENLFVISRKPVDEVELATPFDRAFESHLHDALQFWSEGKVGNVTASHQTNAGGDKVVVLQMTHTETKWKDKCWLLPDKGWAISRYEVVNGQGVLADVGEVQEHGTVNGMVYPKRGRWLHYIGGKLGKSIDFEVEAIETAAGKVPDSLFEMNFPKGASFFDADLNVMVRDSELAQSHLAEVVRRAGSQRWGWWSWLIFAGTMFAGIGILAGGYCWYKRYSKRPAMGTQK